VLLLRDNVVSCQLSFCLVNAALYTALENYFITSEMKHKKKKSKAIPVTDHGGPKGCETSRIPHLLDNRLTDGGEVVSFMGRLRFSPRKIPGTLFR
jgi:hypothetical protein